MDHYFGESPLEQADGILRFASEWEPETAPPDDFTERVMERLDPRRRRRERRARTRSVLGLFSLLLAGAGLACTALALAHINGPQPLVPVGDLQGPSLTRVEPSGAPAGPDAGPAVEIRELPSPALTLAGNAQAAPGNRGAVKTAQWAEETVREPVTRLNTPALLVEQGAEKDTWVVTPGMLDVVIQGGDTACAPAEPQEQKPGPDPSVEPGACTPAATDPPAIPDLEK